MEAQDLLVMLRRMRDVSFATVDDRGHPQVRIIDVMLVEEDRLVFCTARGKDFRREIAERPYVAITGLNDAWQTVRLAGSVRRLDDQRSWIDRIFEENPSMNGVYPGDARYILEAFALEEGQLEFFDLGVSPIYRESLSFGGARPRCQGFVITDDCIACGACAAECPQSCIFEGDTYEIQQEHCLHCGLCVETCPVGAIERRNAA